LAHLPALEATKERQQRSLARARRGKVREARASTTDPEARVMKMADGGFRPAYNLQLATDSAGVIVGVDVTNQGTDAGQAAPMEKQVARRAGQHPGAYLMDGGFVEFGDLTTLAERKVTVYAPVRAPRSGSGRQRRDPRWGDTEAVVQWRARMETEEAQTIYKQRGALAEWANAQIVERFGLRQFTVRGLSKVANIVLLAVIAHDLMRWATLTAQAQAAAA
jgi:hypothetical protein